MKTSQKQISLFTMDKLISSQAGSLVNRIAQRAKEKGKTMIVTSGHTCCELFEKSGLAGSWAKTFSALLLGMEGWYSRRCALNLRLKVTPYNRMFFQLQPLAHRTEEIESGLLPTPTTQETPHYDAQLTNSNRRMATDGNSHSLNLADYAIRGLLPTPTCMDSTNATATMKSTQVKEGSMHSVTLSRAMAMGMLPTPTSSDVVGVARSNVQYENGSFFRENKDGVRWGAKLRDVVETGKSSQLNPRFVAEMMGFPPNWTELPFLNGEQNQ